MCVCVKCVTVAAQRHSANTQFVSIKLKDQKKQGRNVKRKHEINADLALFIRTGSVATLTTSCFTNWKINEQRTDSVSPAWKDTVTSFSFFLLASFFDPSIYTFSVFLLLFSIFLSVVPSQPFNFLYLHHVPLLFYSLSQHFSCQFFSLSIPLYQFILFHPFISISSHILL